MQENYSHLFMSLIYSFQMQAMMQMGKLKNPVTQEIEMDLDAAQVTIDMLDMMKEKTKGNLIEQEDKFLTQVVADLKLNYVNERSKTPEESKPEIGSEESLADGNETATEEGKE